MNHIFAKIKRTGRVFHLFSHPEYASAAAMLQVFDRIYSGVDLTLTEGKVPVSWSKDGRPSALEFSREYWRGSTTLDLPTSEFTSDRSGPSSTDP